MRYFFLLSILFFSCAKIDTISNLNNNKILVIGHGGGGFQSFTNPLPANSWATIERALIGLDANASEIDIQMSSDNSLVLYHDEKLHTQTNCDGCVYEYTAEELQACKYKGVFQNERIVPLDSVIAHYANLSHQYTFFLDLKPFNFCKTPNDPDLNEVAKLVADLIRLHNAYDWIFPESRSVPLLQKIQNIDDRIKIIYDPIDITDGLTVCAANDFQGFALHNDDVSKTDIEMAHDQGFKVMIYGVGNRRSSIKAINKSPDGIMTDNIEVLQGLLR